MSGSALPPPNSPFSKEKFFVLANGLISFSCTSDVLLPAVSFWVTYTRCTHSFPHCFLCSSDGDHLCQSTVWAATGCSFSVALWDRQQHKAQTLHRSLSVSISHFCFILLPSKYMAYICRILHASCCSFSLLQLVDITGKDQDESMIALHDCNGDVNRAINVLLEGSPDTVSSGLSLEVERFVFVREIAKPKYIVFIYYIIFRIYFEMAFCSALISICFSVSINFYFMLVMLLLHL